MPLTPELQQTRRHRLVLLALWLVLYGSFTLFSPPLLDDADSVHAEVAREMLLRHDWVTLYANGIRYLEKAPLFYWLMALSMKLFGSLLGLTAASRLPLAGAVAALTLASESFARRAFGLRAGLYAGLITLSSFGIFIFSRINIPDLLVCFLLTAALFYYFVTESQAQPSRRFCWTFSALLALDVLTKGLIGVVFPVAIVAAHMLLTRGLRGSLRRLKQMHPLSSTIILLAIAVPWHVLAGLANPSQGSPVGITFAHGHFSVPLPSDGQVHGWTWFYFINEQVLRYLNLRVPRDYDTVPLGLFLGLIFIWLMPWSAFLPTALWRARPSWRRLRQRTVSAAERTNLLMLLWAAIPLAFFAFSTRQEYYVLPALPPMIFLVAGFLSERGFTGPPAGQYLAAQPQGLAATLAIRCAAILAIAGIVGALACLSLILHTKAPAPGTDLSSLLQQNPGDYALSFGHFLDLNANAMGMFRLPLILTAIALGILLPLAYVLRHAARFVTPRIHLATLLTAASAFLFLFAAWLGLRTFSPTLTSFQLAQAIKPQLQPQDLIVIHGEYEAGSTLGFYLSRPGNAGQALHLVEGRSSNLWYGSFFPDAPRLFETRESIAQRWAGPQRIFVWQDPHDLDLPPLSLAPMYVIASSGGKQILSNQPNR